MSSGSGINAAEALSRLKDGNIRYLKAETNTSDISPEIRKRTYEYGQSPYAVIIACSDSRVIPESIFSAGIGELFVIRVAGNVIGDHQLGSVEYAVEHLGSKLVLVLGHTSCGAVGAAIEGEPDGFVRSITDEIKQAIGDEKDEFKASCLNVERGVRRIQEGLRHLVDNETIEVIGAIYHTDSGKVDFLE